MTNKTYKPENYGLNLPTKEGWIVCFKDKKGKIHSTELIFKQKWRAKEKADVMMLEEQKEYFITECCY